MAVPALRLHLGQSDFASFPDSIDGVQGVNLLDEKWPEGSTLALQVVVTRADQPATQAAIETLQERLLEVDGLSGPVETQPSADGTVALVSVVMAGGQNDLRNRDIVREVRETIVPEVFGGLDGVEALVTGRAAFTFDVVDFYSDGMPQVIGFVLALSFLLLLVAFRSIVIPIKAILLNLLSTGAAFGLLVLVFQDGHGADLLGFKPGPDRGVRAGLHLHDPVRALDGLPRVHPHPDQGGPRSRAVARTRRSRGASPSRPGRSPARRRSWSRSSRCS